MMIKIIITLVLGFISTYPLFAQVNNFITYREQIVNLRKGMHLLEKDSIKESAFYFKKAIDIGNLNSYYSYQAMFVFASIGNNRMVKQLIRNLPMRNLLFCNSDTTKYCILTWDILKDTIILRCLSKNKSGQRVINKLNKKINYYRNKADDIQISFFEKMVESDQRVRNMYMNADSTNRLSLWEELVKVDTSNFKQFVNFIKTNGWPSQNQFGDLPEYLYWHCNIELDYLNFISLEASKRNELEWEVYEHFYKRAFFSLDFIFSNKGYTLSLPYNLKSKIQWREAKAYLEAVIDYIDYYTVKYENVKLEINVVGDEGDVKEKINNILASYNPSTRNASVIFVHNPQLKNCIKFTCTQNRL